jgi:UDP-MurNAc hydroxylase
MSLQLTYYYSACIKICACGENNNISILCDPWFTEPIYHGSWYQYPPYRYNALEEIGDVDFIYISHIHPDHYDPVFLRKYISNYGSKPILIQDRKSNYLLSKMRRDGFNPTPIESIEANSANIRIVPVQPSNVYEIDSALVVKSSNGHSIVNLNDCNYDDDLVAEISDYCNHQVSVALMNYTPASSYPQCYNLSKSAMRNEVDRIKSIYQQKFFRFKSALGPKLAIPFAGQYIIGGKNYSLNQNLGVCDAVDLALYGEDVAVLETNTSISTANLDDRVERRDSYKIVDILDYSKTLAKHPYEYESTLAPDLGKTITSLYEPLQCCLTSKKVEPFTLFIASSDSTVSYISEYSISDTDLRYELHKLHPLSAEEAFSMARTLKNDLVDYLCIYLEPKLLHAILLGQIHWNNVYVASLANYDRSPLEKHRKDVFELLSLMRPLRHSSQSIT